MARPNLKKLRLLAIRSREDELLRELMLLGCVEISEPEEPAAVPEPTEPGTGGAEKSRAEHDRLLSALELLDEYAPEKSKIFSARQEISAETLFEWPPEEELLSAAAEICAAGDNIRSVEADRERTRELIEALRPWETMELPLEITGTAASAVITGYVGARADTDALEEALRDTADESRLFAFPPVRERRGVLVICLRTLVREVTQVLGKFDFEAETFGRLRGTAADNIKRAEARLERLSAERERLKKIIASYALRRGDLKLCADRAGVNTALAEAKECFLRTSRTVFFEGLFASQEEEKLSALFRRCGCAFETEPLGRLRTDGGAFNPVAVNTRFTRLKE